MVDANSEDDGEGINGVGFRPTAAMAHKRAERRRLQVAEWRAREAREARVRRAERRRGCGGRRGITGGAAGDATVSTEGDRGMDVDAGEAEQRRVVRFAE